MSVSTKISHHKLYFIPMLAIAFIFAALTSAIVAFGLQDRLPASDAAIVLGSKVLPDGIPSSRLKARLDMAIALHQQGLVHTIIVSGGLGREGFDEAAVMQHYLIAAGIAQNDIIMDSQGNNTAATARNSAAIMRKHGWQSAIIVTQYFHIARCWLELRRAGIHQLGSAHPAFFEIRDIYSIPRETVACIVLLLNRIGAIH